VEVLYHIDSLHDSYDVKRRQAILKEPISEVQFIHFENLHEVKKHQPKSVLLEDVLPLLLLFILNQTLQRNLNDLQVLSMIYVNHKANFIHCCLHRAHFLLEQAQFGHVFHTI